MKLAIVGSRNYEDYTEFKNVIAKTLKKWNVTIADIEKIISGGAKGADSLADKFAKENDIPITNFYPDWKAFGKAAGVMRNTDIVNECTHIIAFPSRDGSGTQDSIRKARKENKIIEVMYID